MTVRKEKSEVDDRIILTAKELEGSPGVCDVRIVDVESVRRVSVEDWTEKLGETDSAKRELSRE